MLPSVVSRLFILVFGTLYPAYTSYKAVRNKDPREYVKCMMYWIVFALYCTVETFTDVFLSFWFPFYHELKILILLWLMSPSTRGSTYLYTKLVHPTLTSREQEIDEAIAMAKRQGYTTVMKLGSRGVNYATNIIMQTALKGLQLPPNTFSVPTLPTPPPQQPTSGTSSSNQGTSEPDGYFDTRPITDDWMLGPSSIATKRTSPAEMFSDDDEDVKTVLTKQSEEDEDYEPVVAKPRSRKGGTRGRKARPRSTRSNADAN